MFAGLLKEPIEIYDFVTTKSIQGVVSNQMSKIYETRAKVGHIGGSKTVINNEITTPYQKNFVMRIYVPITDTSWIKYGGEFYRVTSIDKDIELRQIVVTSELVEE